MAKLRGCLSSRQPNLVQNQSIYTRVCILVRNGTQCLPHIEFLSRDNTTEKLTSGVHGVGGRDVTISTVHLLDDTRTLTLLNGAAGLPML